MAIATFLSLTLTFLTLSGTIIYHMYIFAKRAKVHGKMKRMLRYIQLLYRQWRGDQTYEQQALEGYVDSDEGSINGDDSDAGTNTEIPPMSQYREPQLVDFDSVSVSIN